MTRSLLLLLLVGPLAAAPVPKVKMANVDDVTTVDVHLMALPAVQRELKLTGDQRAKLVDGLEAVEEEWQKERSQSPTADPHNYLKGGRTLVASVLTEAQLVRLRECQVQCLGCWALRLSRVEDELAFTEKQKEELKAVLLEPAHLVYNPHSEGSWLGATTDDEKERAAAKKWGGFVETFSPAQAKRWKELNGEKVGFDRRKVAGKCSSMFGMLHSMYADPEAVQKRPLPQLPPPAFDPIPPAGGK